MNRKSKFVSPNWPKTPFWALAPMANITTYPFASQCSKYGADLVWTPMVHTDTIVHNWPEAEKILDFKDLRYVIQLVGSEPRMFTKAIEIILEHGLKPLSFDLNAGCPDKNIVKSGCGGALLKNPDRIMDIIGAMRSATEIPISVKTRAGFDNLTDIYDLMPRLVNLGISMITIHPRTVKQGYAGFADWKVVKNLKLKTKNPEILVIGSGDIKTWQEAVKRQQETSCDGIMIGRGALGRPWIFDEIKSRTDHRFDPLEVKKLVLDLADKANALWGTRGIVESRKHFAWYYRGFDGAKEIRARLMLAQTLEDVQEILNN